jgi:hypothetical protein
MTMPTANPEPIVERVIIVSLLQARFKKDLEVLAREIGPALNASGLNRDEIAIALMNCAEIAFKAVLDERRGKHEKK